MAKRPAPDRNSKSNRKASAAATANDVGSDVMASDVIVVGGGLVGMTFAATLSRSGINVTVIERADPETLVAAPHDGRASAIAYGSQRLLNAAGLWHGMKDHAEPILDIRVVEGGSPLFLHFNSQALGNKDPADNVLGYMLENRHNRAALYAAAAKLPLNFVAPASITDIDRGPGLVTVTLDDGRIFQAPLLVAADGVRSKLREDAGITVHGWSYRQVGIVCTVKHEKPHCGVALENFLPMGPFAVLPLKDNRSSIVWTEKESTAPAIVALNDHQFLEELKRRFGDYLGEIEIEGMRWAYPLKLQHAESYTASRLALIGDAAHGMHPIAGQGLNLGIRDVGALAEVIVDARRLGQDIGAKTVLDRYAQWRRFDNLTLLAVTDNLNKLFSTDVMPIKIARKLGIAAVDKIPPLKNFLMEHARGTVGDLPRLLQGAPL